MDSSLSTSTDQFKLSIAIDSGDILYKLSFVSLEAGGSKYESAGNLIKAACLERPISEILKLGSRDISQPSMAIESVLYSLKLLIKEFQGSNVEKIQTSESDLSQLVCRCNFLDKKTLEALFTEAKGDYKKALLASNASLICSSCSADVKAVYEGMTFEELEKRYERVKKAVEEELLEFSLVCPPDYEGLELSAASVKNETVKIKASGDRKGLGRNQIKKTLENFISKESLDGLGISIFF